LKQIENFKYLGSEISYENRKYIRQKLGKFAQILGILNNFKVTLVQKISRLWRYNALALPILLFEEKFGPPPKKKIKCDWDQSRWTFSEEDHKSNGKILVELQVKSVD
jgi:hypothetical protein